MSASSGILPSAELKATFQDAHTQDNLRALAVVIENEQLVAKESLQREGDAAEDFGQLESRVQPAVPSFFLFRLDDGTWLLVIYVPDIAPVRQKMLYASSRANLTRALGDSDFSDSLHAHSPADLTSAAYRAHLNHASSSAPMTEREQELATLKEAEGVEARGTGPRGGAFSTSSGSKGKLAWDEDAESAVRDLTGSQQGAVHLVLDVGRETVVLSSISAAGQPNIPTDTPSYNLIAHRGSIALVYCCPPSSPVKSRLLYSASLRGIQQHVVGMGLQVTKRLETSDASDVTSSWLDSELGLAAHAAPSPASTHSPTFSRPKRPGGRAPARRVVEPDATVALPAQTTEGETEASLP